MATLPPHLSAVMLVLKLEPGMRAEVLMEEELVEVDEPPALSTGMVTV